MPRDEEARTGAQKKVVHASERQTDRVRLERWLFKRFREQLEPKRILFFDESGINLSMGRRYGRGLRGARVREVVESAGASILFLPPYSPDLNPIELAWSKMKTLLRSEGARTPEALERAVAEAFSKITERDIEHWILHCGYGCELRSA